MKIKNKKTLIIGVITFLDMFINIYNNIRTAENGVALAIVCGVLLALCDMFTLFSIIEIANKPVLGMILLTISQVTTLIYELVDGATLNEALTDMGVMGVIVIAALVFHIVTAYKKVKTDKNVSVGKKIVDTINYKRTIYNVKVYTRVIIYSLIISAVLSLANSNILSTVNTNISFRIYSAFVLVLPAMLIIGIITTSYIAYDIFILKLFFEVYTVYLLVSVGNFDFIQIIYIVVEVLAIMYAYFITFKDKTGENNEEKK